MLENENGICDLKSQDSHRCEYCAKCGREQRTYWGVTPTLWEQVVPKHYRSSVLCWECFLRYADIQDISFTIDDITIFGFVGTFGSSKARFPKLIDTTHSPKRGVDILKEQYYNDGVVAQRDFLNDKIPEDDMDATRNVQEKEEYLASWFRKNGRRLFLGILFASIVAFIAGVVSCLP